MLDEDTDTILSYIASNGLVANPKKSVFMLLDQKGMTTDTPMATIRVGEAIESFSRNAAKIWNQALNLCVFFPFMRIDISLATYIHLT